MSTLPSPTFGVLLRRARRAAGDPRTARQVLTNLGRVASDQGDLERAVALYTDSLEQAIALALARA